jgi:hypothetical protein
MARTALERFLAARRARREDNIRESADTRTRRRADRLWQAAELWRDGALTPSNRCRCCGRPLTDPESIARSIGSECWGRVLAAAHRRSSVRAAP